MGDEQGAAWCYGMRDEIIGLAMESMVCGNVAIVGPRVEHVERYFGLGQQMVPLIDGEIGMCSHEDREEVSTKSLDGALGLVCAFLVRWNALHVDMLLFEEPHK